MSESVSASETVVCHVSGKEEPVISGRIPFREPLKSEVQARIGAYTWRLWLDQQLKIINEYRLNLGDPSSRDLIERGAREFFKFDGAGPGLETGVDKAKELGNLPGDYNK